MVKNELLDYINGEIAKGIPLNFIKETLRKNDWSDVDIEEACEVLFPEEKPIAIDKNVNSFGMMNPYPVMPDEAKMKKRFFLWAMVALVFLLLAGGTIYGYYSGYLVSMPKVAQEALGLVAKSSSVNFDTTTTLDWSQMKEGTGYDTFSGGLASSRKLSFNIKGQYDSFHADDVKGSLELLFTLGAVTSDVEVKLAKEVLYAEVKQFPNIAFFDQFTKLQNKWVKFPVPEVQKLRTDNLLNQSTLLTFSGVDPMVVANLQAEQKSKLYEITRNASFFKITKKLPVEDINGDTSYHFIFEPDYPGIKTYLDNLKVYAGTLVNYGVPAFDSEKAYQEITTSVKSFEGNAWVSRKTGFPTKVTITLGMVNPQKIDQGELKIETTSLFNNWNIPITVTPPEESIDMNELWKSFSKM